jgi:ABC-type sulfate/molybdate transport systems ATPase subunit
MFLEVSGISKKGESDDVLKDIRFTQKLFQRIVIAGETGSGKSTLLKIIAGLIQPDEGEIRFEKERVRGPEEKLVPGHDSIAYLSQHFELPRSLRVEQILTYANKRNDEEADLLYQICRIDHLLKRRTDQLSGGEKQRIALAHLLIRSPRLLLLDEPFSHLDMTHKNTLKAVIEDIGNQFGISCVLVSHDPLDTLPWAHQIIVLKRGMIIQKGTPHGIYSKPVNDYVAGLFGKYNRLTEEQLSFLIKKKTRKTAIVRPEDLKMQVSKTKGMKGVVKKIFFFGSYFESIVLANNQYLTVRTETPFKKGDIVYLTVDLDAVVYI